MDLYIYADETRFDRPGSKPADTSVGYGVLICPAPIGSQVIDEALEALEKDEDRHREPQKRADDLTLRRGFFHAADDSPNGHSHLCTSIRTHIKGAFSCVLLDGVQDDHAKTVEQLYKEAFRLSLLEICHRARNVHLVVERRNQISAITLAGDIERLYRGAISTVFDMAGEPLYCPPVRIDVGDKSTPGLQVIDFLLWASVRPESQAADDLWLKRLAPVIRVAMSAEDGPVTDSAFHLDWSSIDSVASPYPHSVESHLAASWPSDLARDWDLIEQTVRRVAAENPLPVQHLGSFLASASKALSSRSRAEASGAVREIASAFLAIFDTLPVYSGLAVTDQGRWSELLSARRTAAMVVKGQHGTLQYMRMCFAVIDLWRSKMGNRSDPHLP